MSWEFKLTDGSTIIGDEVYKTSYIVDVIKINKHLDGYFRDEKDWIYDITTIPYNNIVYFKQIGLTNDDYIEYNEKYEAFRQSEEEEDDVESEENTEKLESCENCENVEYKSTPITDDSMYI